MTVRELLLKIAMKIDQTGKAERNIIRILQGRCPRCGADISPASRDYLCADCARKEDNEDETL